MKILLTGFTPFGGDIINPSWEAVRRLPDQLGDITIYKENIITAFGAASEAVEKAIRKYNPDTVICAGLSNGRSLISVEKVAINYRYASIPDNLGTSPRETPVCPDGPAAYFATIPAEKIAEAMRAEGIPAAVSYSAGTYVCNDTFYSLMHMIANRYPGIAGGFIHVPYIPEQVVDKPAGTPSMALPIIQAALETAIRVTAEQTGTAVYNSGAVY